MILVNVLAAVHTLQLCVVAESAISAFKMLWRLKTSCGIVQNLSLLHEDCTVSQ